MIVKERYEVTYLLPFCSQDTNHTVVLVCFNKCLIVLYAICTILKLYNTIVLFLFIMLLILLVSCFTNCMYYVVCFMLYVLCCMYYVVCIMLYVLCCMYYVVCLYLYDEALCKFDTYSIPCVCPCFKK